MTARRVESAETGAAARRLRAQRLRRALLIAGGSLILLLLLSWLLISRFMGSWVSGFVKTRAAESLNGRLEFASLDIDLAGRAVMKDVSIVPADGETPIVSCPEVRAAVDLFTLFGPNRGARAVVINLSEPQLELRRRPDGSLNVLDLIKPPEEKRQPWGLAIRISNARIDFSDECLLSQSYPTIPQKPDLLGDLLREAGYKPAGPSAAADHSEVLTLNGTLTYNARRKLIGTSLELERTAPGGVLTLRGTALDDGTRYDLRLGARDLDLRSLQSYVQTLFPNLELLDPQAPIADEVPIPALALLIESGSFTASKQPDAAALFGGTVELERVHLSSGELPELDFSKFGGDYDPRRELLKLDLELLALDGTLTGKPQFDFADKTLSGKLNLQTESLAALLKYSGAGELALTGEIRTALTLGGTFAQPEATAELNGSNLLLGKLKLGKVHAEASLRDNQLELPEARFSGGAVPLKLSGRYELEPRNGRFSVNAGPLSVTDAWRLVQTASADAGGGKKKEPAAPPRNLSGELTATAELTIRNGKLSSALTVQSPKLKSGELTFTTVKVKGNSTPGVLNIDSAEAKLTLPQAVTLAGYQDSGPLALNLRTGGKVKLPTKSQQQAQLDLTGKASTSNLAPAQADIAFKISGPAKAPVLKLQLKTLEDTPLALNANLTWKTGAAPLTATLTWQGTSIDYAGTVELQKQTLDGKLTAKAVDLRRFMNNPQLAGTLTATAQLSGPFKKLTITGQASAPVISYSFTQRLYQVTDFAAGFKLAPGAKAEDSVFSLSDGRFNFEGNAFTASGILGRSGKQLTLTSSSFNLFSVLALFPHSGVQGPAQPGRATAEFAGLDIVSSGPLNVVISGEPADPQLALTYSSGAGSVEGHAFDSAEVTANGNLRSVELTRFVLRSTEGSLSATGSVKFAPVEKAKGSPRVSTYSLQLTVDDFDAGVLTPLSGQRLLTSLSGRLGGSLKLSGSPEDYQLDGELKLINGKYEGIAITEAGAEFATQRGGAVLINNGYLASNNTQLTVSGKLGPGPGAVELTAHAAKLDLAILAPWLPANAPQPSGNVKLDLTLLPGARNAAYPNLTLALEDTGGGVRLGEAHFDKLAADATLANDLLNLQELRLTAGTSTLTAGGELPLQSLTGGLSGGPLKLNAWVKSQSFDLADLKALLAAVPSAPGRGGLADNLPAGTLSCDLKLAGTSKEPIISGPVSFHLASLPPGLPLEVEAVDGRVEFTKNAFDLQQLTLTAVSGEQADVAGQALLSGSGKLGFNPLTLSSGALSVALGTTAGGAAKYFKVVYPTAASGKPEVFKGYLGGQLTLQPLAGGGREDGLFADLSGSLTVNGPGLASLYIFQPSGKQTASKPQPLRLKNLQLVINPGTEVRYRPPEGASGIAKSLGFNDFKAEVQGALALNGIPGKSSGTDALSVKGVLTIPGGSFRVYKHVIKLDAGANKLEFTGTPGDFYPILTAQGSLTLPRILPENAAIGEGTAIMEMPSLGGSGDSGSSGRRDLKILIKLNRVKLGATMPSIELSQVISSQPPLPVEQILAYLTGGLGAILSGEGDLSDFAEGELLSFGSSFISRAIEEGLGLSSFQLGGSGDADNPYYVDVEKEITPQVSLSYFRDFYSQNGQSEEFGIKYKVLEEGAGHDYAGLDLQLNFEQNGFSGSNTEFMFNYSWRF